MKKIVVVLVVVFSVLGCKKSVVEEPEKLIEKDKMIDILYDLTLLQSAENYNSTIMTQNGVKPNEIVYKKYGIDSVTFAQSNRYYGAHPKEFQEMFRKVSERVALKKEELNKEMIKKGKKPTPTSEVPAIQ